MEFNGLFIIIINIKKVDPKSIPVEMVNRFQIVVIVEIMKICHDMRCLITKPPQFIKLECSIVISRNF